MENNVFIDIQNVTKKYKETVVLNNISLKVNKGSTVGIVGRNGSGKTILFKVICGLTPINSGKMLIDGMEMKKGFIPNDLGILIESPGYVEHLTAFDNLKILAAIKNKITNEDIFEVLSLVGLDPKNKLPMKKYSLGMKQRYGIAQAIMEKPKLLILDEPMNGLDEDGVNTIRNILLKLKDNNVTILLSSHNSEDIDVLCDKVYKMAGGNLEEKVPVI